MVFSIFTCCLLVIATTVFHYEVLRFLNVSLHTMRIPKRAKLIVVILWAFVAHAAEIALYGIVFYGFVVFFGDSGLVGSQGFSLASSMYFSAETYTSLGFGDIAPTGPIRLLAGVEALNGLLLIGWSVSFTYISMERFWNVNSEL